MRKENSQNDQMATDPCTPEEAAKKSSHYEMHDILKLPSPSKRSEGKLVYLQKRLLKITFRKDFFQI